MSKIVISSVRAFPAHTHRHESQALKTPVRKLKEPKKVRFYMIIFADSSQHSIPLDSRNWSFGENARNSQRYQTASITILTHLILIKICSHFLLVTS